MRYGLGLPDLLSSSGGVLPLIAVIARVGDTGLVAAAIHLFLVGHALRPRIDLVLQHALLVEDIALARLLERVLDLISVLLIHVVVVKAILLLPGSDDFLSQIRGWHVLPVDDLAARAFIVLVVTVQRGDHARPRLVVFYLLSQSCPLVDLREVRLIHPFLLLVELEAP